MEISGAILVGVSFRAQVFRANTFLLMSVAVNGTSRQPKTLCAKSLILRTCRNTIMIGNDIALLNTISDKVRQKEVVGIHQFRLFEKFQNNKLQSMKILNCYWTKLTLKP